MIKLAKSVLNWYEKTAYKYVGGIEVHNQDAPITLDRLWDVCKKYALGDTNSLFKKDDEGRINIASFNFHFYDKSFSTDSRRDGGSLASSLLIGLAVICLAVLIPIWFLSGIAFKHVFKNVIESTKNSVENIFKVFIGILGSIIGATIGAVKGIFSSHKNTYLEFIKAGATTGYKQGSEVGRWLGFFAGIAITPVAAIVGLPLGIAAGLPIAALTLVVAPLQFIKNTHNYIDQKFEEELQSNHNKQQPVDYDSAKSPLINTPTQQNPPSPPITNKFDASKKDAAELFEEKSPSLSPRQERNSPSMSF